jgi:hypothetical protein
MIRILTNFSLKIQFIIPTRNIGGSLLDRIQFFNVVNYCTNDEYKNRNLR